MRRVPTENFNVDDSEFTPANGALEDVRGLRVLVIDDDEDDFLLTFELLGEVGDLLCQGALPCKGELSGLGGLSGHGGLSGQQVEWAQTYEQGMAALESRPFDICLLDYHLGARDGLEFLDDALGRGITVPIIVLTGESSREIDQAAIDGGAADYLVKGEITSALLERAIRHTFDRRRSQEGAQLLAEAGARLTSSLDSECTLESVARLITGRFADYCIIDLVGNNGELKRLRVAARDAANRDVADWAREAPLTEHVGCIVRQALATCKSVLIEQVDQGSLLARETLCDAHREFIERVRPVSMMAVPLMARERLMGSILFVTAESGRRYDREDLALAEQLAFRTALATDNARLYRDSQRAVERRDEVHRVVAHDLRNPLSTVKMVADLLERSSAKGTDPCELRKHLGVQRHAVSRMNRLIEDLLDVARIEAGQLSVEPLPCTPATLVACVVEQQTAQAQERSIDLSSHIEEGLPDIYVDHDRIEQAFSNLVGNALKFTPRGGRVELRVRRQDDRVRFSVSDNGPGIAPEQRMHLFDRFWQADKAARHGAGLGLAITRGIVEAHGGHIWVESTSGQGTTFYFDLPTGLPRHVN